MYNLLDNFSFPFIELNLLNLYAYISLNLFVISLKETHCKNQTPAISTDTDF